MDWVTKLSLYVTHVLMSNQIGNMSGQQRHLKGLMYVFVTVDFEKAFDSLVGIKDYFQFWICILCCSECSRNPQEAIESRVGTLGETFLREYVQVINDSKQILEWCLIAASWFLVVYPSLLFIRSDTYVLTSFFQPSPDRPKSPCSTREFATKRLKLAEILYFKVWLTLEI